MKYFATIIATLFVIGCFQFIDAMMYYFKNKGK